MQGKIMLRTSEFEDNITCVEIFKTHKWITLIIILFLSLSLFSCEDSDDKNEKIAKLFYEQILNGKNTELIGEIISPDIEFYRPDHKGDRLGIDAFRDYVNLNHKLSPDLKVQIDDMISEDNKIAVRYTINGIEATSGYRYSAEGISILQIDNGKISKIWENADDLNFLIQIGQIPNLDYPHKHEPE